MILPASACSYWLQLDTEAFNFLTQVEKAAGKPLPVPQEPENSDEEAEGEETELVAQLNASLEQEESTATTTGCVSKRPREDAVPAESKRKKKQLPKQESVNDVVADAGGAPIDTETDEAGNASDASVPSAGDKRKSVSSPGMDEELKR